jgi:hypothetical protein
MLKIIRKRKAKILERLLAPENVDGVTLTRADVIDGAARSGMGRVFAEPMKRAFAFSFCNEDFIAYCRYFLSLPPRLTINNATQQPGFDYPVQACLASHDVHTSQFLDAGGAHASSNCKAIFQPRYQKHNRIVNALAKAATEAGLQVLREPDTFNLLLREFTQAECHKLFPKDASPA